MEWITTDNIKKETWRRLLEFANDEFSISKMETRCKNLDKRAKQNQRKQAKQIRLCLLQAKEYLESAEKSSIITSPNLMYYAATSLCSAVMLINSDGSKSLDFLRERGKSKNHGLAVQVQPVTKISEGIKLLENTYIEVKPHGFFKEWYETLPSREKKYCRHKTFESEESFITGIIESGANENLAFEKIVGEKVTLIELLKKIPDHVDDLKRLGVKIFSSLMDEKITRTKEFTHRKWILHNAHSEEALQSLLNEFKVQNSPNNTQFEITKSKSQNGAIVELQYQNNEDFIYHWPENRWDMNGKAYCFPNTLSVSEIVDCFGILCAIGMICRYYPDIWIETIDKHSVSAKIIENTIETMKLKLPMLALELMAGDKIVISSHLNPSDNSAHE